MLTYDDLVARGVTESWVTLDCVSNEVGGRTRRQRPVERRTDRRPARGGRGDGRRGLRAADVGGRVDLRDPAQRAHRRPRRDAGGRDERPAAADRARLPGAHGRAGALRLRVGDEVGGGPRGDPLRRRRRLLDRPGLVRARAGQDRLPDRRAALRRRRRRGRVDVGGVAWNQHTGISAVEVALDGGAWERAVLAEIPSVDTWVQWSVTVDVTDGDHDVRVRAIGRDGQAQTGVVRTSYRTARPAGTRSRSAPARCDAQPGCPTW